MSDVVLYDRGRESGGRSPSHTRTALERNVQQLHILAGTRHSTITSSGTNSNRSSTTSLLSLPFDVLLQIVQSLDVEDVMRLVSVRLNHIFIQSMVSFDTRSLFGFEHPLLPDNSTDMYSSPRSRQITTRLVKPRHENARQMRATTSRRIPSSTHTLNSITRQHSQTRAYTSILLEIHNPA